MLQKTECRDEWGENQHRKCGRFYGRDTKGSAEDSTARQKSQNRCQIRGSQCPKKMVMLLLAGTYTQSLSESMRGEWETRVKKTAPKKTALLS